MNLPFVESKTVSGSKTRVTLTADYYGVSQIEVISASGPPYSMPTLPSSLFRVSFRKYDFATRSITDQVDYFVNTLLDATTPPPLLDPEPVVTANAATINFKGVKTNHARHGGDKIDVKVDIKAGAGANNGWLEFDIQTTYPPFALNDSNTAGWQVEVSVPSFLVASDVSSSHHLLGPGNSSVGLDKLAKNNPSGWSQQVLSPQFAALYTFSQDDRFIQGLAFCATDTEGYYKEIQALSVNNEMSSPAQGKPNTLIRFKAVQPIYTKGGKFRRPDLLTLSGGGNNNGFSGMRMNFLMRGFYGRSPDSGVKPDWMLPAALYRKRLKDRLPAYFQPKTRPTEGANTGPVDEMAPYTIAMNYAFEGVCRPDENVTRALQTEMHPLADRPTGPWPANTNEKLGSILQRTKAAFKISELKLEAQIWGLERGGFYVFPPGQLPTEDTLYGAGRLLTFASNLLTDQKIYAQITTDPLNIAWKRFFNQGHIDYTLSTGPQPFLKDRQFPEAFAETGTITWTDTATGKVYNRIFSTRNSPASTQLRNAAKCTNEKGQALTRDLAPNATSGFNQVDNFIPCPNDVLKDIYTNAWVDERIFKNHVPLVEVMKNRFSAVNAEGWGCYDCNHKHSHLPPNANFDNVMGPGPWFIKRFADMLSTITTKGRLSFPFMYLSFEHLPPEFLLPHFEDYYQHGLFNRRDQSNDTRSLNKVSTGELYEGHYVPLYAFLFSTRITEKLPMLDFDILHYPGYKDLLISAPPSQTPRLYPPSMTDAARDADTSGILFEDWQRLARQDFDQYYKAPVPGLSPQNYPVVGGPNYSYRKGVDSIFNLRYSIFRYGIAGVNGMRILLPAEMLHKPYEYNDVVIKYVAAAVRMQREFRNVFRYGEILGTTSLRFPQKPGGINPTLHAWRAKMRAFNDNADIVAAANAQNMTASPLWDYLARGTDKVSTMVPVQSNSPPGSITHVEYSNAVRVKTDQVHHLVWRKNNDPVRAYYVFANVGNTEIAFDFTPIVGLENAPPPTIGWQYRETHYRAVDSPAREQFAAKQLGTSCSIRMMRMSFCVVEFFY